MLLPSNNWAMIMTCCIALPYDKMWPLLDIIHFSVYTFNLFIGSVFYYDDYDDYDSSSD
jgi:hypothetical protein